jgi:hypothetical protein
MTMACPFGVSDLRPAGELSLRPPIEDICSRRCSSQCGEKREDAAANAGGAAKRSQQNYVAPWIDARVCSIVSRGLNHAESQGEDGSA